MKYIHFLLMRHALRRQSAAMVSPLIITLFLALVQPISSQVYVNSSSYFGNARASTPERTDHTKPSLGSLHPTGRTEGPFKTDDEELSRGLEGGSVKDKDTVEMFNQGDIVFQPVEHNISKNIEETSAHPTTVDIKVEHANHSDRTEGGITPTRRPKVRPITTTPTQHIEGPSAMSKAMAFSEGSGQTLRREPMTEELVTESNEEDLSTSDVLIPTVDSLAELSAETVQNDGAENAQYRRQIQTAYSILTTVSSASKYPTISVMHQPKPSTNTVVREKLAATSALNLTSPREPLADEGGGATASRTISTSSESTPLNTSTSNLPPKTPPPRETPVISTNLQPRNTTKPTKAAATSNQQPKAAVSSTTSPQRPENKIFRSLPTASTTNQQNPTDTATSPSTSLPPPSERRRMVPLENAIHVEKDSSIFLGSMPSVKPGPNRSTFYIAKEPCDPTLGLCASPKEPTVHSEVSTSNGSLLVWADLSRTLSFAWELHVFGSAALFLLLTAGAALGLALAPSMRCPHRGALALANGLLLLAGAIRAAYFLLDPYGSRLLLPLPVVTALYTLPLPLLIWVQAAMVVLILKGVEVTLLPPSLQRPPFLGVLAVLQCTLLLAADLLSPALSPAVPVVLQSLTLTAGLVLCLCYLCLVLPRLSGPEVGRGGDKGLVGPKLRVLSRVLAVCALLGALCCLLHAYTCLWLYGLLGEWRRFRWTWWLCQFWARLLELGWAFCLLLLASWVFWRPRGGQTQRASEQGGTGAGDLPSPCQSSSSSPTHTCWAKIVQSLKGRPHRKSESNGVGGSNGSGGAGELPNNWAGQERSGADISKSLIRNRDPPKESNRGRNQRSGAESSAGSLLRLQPLGQQQQCSQSGSLDRDKESAISLYDFDLRPPSPIDLSRSIDEALHREHLLRGGSLFRPLGVPSPSPSPEPWMRRNSDPQITLSDSSDEHTILTESSAGLDRSIPSAVPSRQVTAPPTPTHQGPRWISDAPVPSSMSCPVSLHPSPSVGRAATPSTDDTRPFLTPELDGGGSQPDSRGGRNYVKVNRQDDSASVSSDIIDL